MTLSTYFNIWFACNQDIRLRLYKADHHFIGRKALSAVRYRCEYIVIYCRLLSSHALVRSTLKFNKKLSFSELDQLPNFFNATYDAITTRYQEDIIH